MQNLCTGKKHFCLVVAIINSPRSLTTKRKEIVSSGITLTFTMFQYTAKEVTRFTPFTNRKLVFSGPFCFVCFFFLTYLYYFQCCLSCELLGLH